jgi:hypothetical protein
VLVFSSLTKLLHAGVQRLDVTGDNPRMGEVHGPVYYHHPSDTFDSIYYEEDHQLPPLQHLRMHVSMVQLLLCEHRLPVTSLTLWNSTEAMSQTWDAVGVLGRVPGLKHLTLELSPSLQPHDRNFIFRCFISRMWHCYPELEHMQSVTVRNCDTFSLSLDDIESMPFTWTIVNRANQVIFSQ